MSATSSFFCKNVRHNSKSFLWHSILAGVYISKYRKKRQKKQLGTVTRQPTNTYLLREEGESMTYSKVKTFNIDGCKVRVHFPDLPEEERTKRKNALMKAAERFLKHAERVKKEKAEQENMPEAKEG